MRSPLSALPTSLFLAASCLTASVAHGQTTVLQEKLLYNTAHTDATTRASAAVDTIYFMQPELFHRGYGNVTGYRVLLQDQDYRTAESVQFGMVKYGQNGLPDVSATGLVNNATGSLMFPQPATGVISAAIWTITLSQPVAAPDTFGLRLVLPAAPSATDGVSVHTQRDTTLKLTASFRKQWTYYLNGTTPVAYYGAGTTIRYGAMYTEPVTQMFVNSTLYGPAEDLFGPEAMHPDTTKGDKVAWEFTGTAFANQVAVLLLDGSLRATPISTNLGSLFLQAPVGIIQLPFVLDATGRARTTPLAPPAKLVLRSQAVFVNLTTGAARASDTAGIVAQ